MKLGAYNIIKKIAEGGIAEIYLAKGKTLQGRDKYLVCKCLKDSVVSDGDFLASILQEAQLSVRMRHPNILEVFDLCASEEKAYLTMEYMDAPDLRHVFMAAHEKQYRMTPGAAIYVIGQAALGLHYAHELVDERGEQLHLVHRDISPENILLCWNGEVKLSDFGIAKTCNMPDITPPDTVKGKFGYMSPEQAWADKVDRRSDIFSLAIVLYEATLGATFYPQSTINDILMAARVGQFDAPCQLDPNYPKALESVLMKALELDKKQRFSTAFEFKMALDNCAKQLHWDTSKEAWLREMSAILGNQPTHIPRMCASEVPNDPNTIISHRPRGDIEIQCDSDSTIQLNQKSLIDELRKLSLKSTASIPAIPCDILNAEIAKRNAEKEAARQAAQALSEQERRVEEEDISKTVERLPPKEIVEMRTKTRQSRHTRKFIAILAVVLALLLVLWIVMIFT